MKMSLKIFITLCLMVTFQSLCISQSSSKRSKFYKTTVFTSDRKIIGSLKEVNENYLVIISNYAPITIPSTSIQRIKIKCTNCAGRGALKGGLIGAGVGIGIGFLLGDDESESELEISFTAGEKALMGGIALGGIGALIGTLGGFVTAEYIEIEGDQRVYTQYLVTLKKYEQMPSEKE